MVTEEVSQLLIDLLKLEAPWKLLHISNSGSVPIANVFVKCGCSTNARLKDVTDEVFQSSILPLNEDASEDRIHLRHFAFQCSKSWLKAVAPLKS